MQFYIAFGFRSSFIVKEKKKEKFLFFYRIYYSSYENPTIELASPGTIADTFSNA